MVAFNMGRTPRSLPNSVLCAKLLQESCVIGLRRKRGLYLCQRSHRQTTEQEAQAQRGGAGRHHGFAGLKVRPCGTRFSMKRKLQAEKMGEKNLRHVLSLHFHLFAIFLGFFEGWCQFFFLSVSSSL